MEQFKFHFQYGPEDLKAIRSANGTTVFSPATTITVWAFGFAVCLLMLGAIGSWETVAIVFVVAVVITLVYVRKMNREVRGDREYTMRSLLLMDNKLVETFGNSQFDKSWDAFEVLIETEGHFLLRHYEKITALPKRVINAGQLEPCREFLEQRIDTDSFGELPEFGEWFSNANSQIFRFRWTEDDIKQLANAKLIEFDPATSSFEFGRIDHNKRKIWQNVIWFLILISFLAPLVFRAGSTRMIKILAFSVAIFIPFFVAFVWWKYTSRLLRKRNPRTPREEISVTTNENDLLIGYPKGTARYSWQDITALYCSDRFVGFRPHNGSVHVIANHAFGGKEQAIEFLLLADHYRKAFDDESKPAIKGSTVVETGNPYQPPQKFE